VAGEILRDRAVPHISRTPRAAPLGLGYAMIEDRLWQMDRLRRRARRQAKTRPQYVQADLMHRAVGIPAIAQREVEQTDERTRDLLESLQWRHRYVDSHQRERRPV
jgi:acyl-homoserine lactone acylase PvdQ